MSNFYIKHYLTGTDRSNVVKLDRTLSDLEKALQFTTADFMDNTAKRMVSPGEFNRGNSDTSWTVTNNGNALWFNGPLAPTSGTTITAIAPISVPNNSIITKLTLYSYFENVSAVQSAMSIKVWRTDKEDNTLSMGQLFSTVAVGYNTDELSSFSPNKFDTTNYNYYLQLIWGFLNPTAGLVWADIFKCCGVKLEYQVRP